MKKFVLIALIVVSLIAGLFIIKKMKRDKGPAFSHHIGILQTASHPALDAVREAFIQELMDKTSGDVSCTTYNAQGSVSSAHAMAQQLEQNKEFNGFFCIATAATVALSSLEKKRPIVVAAVTDPVSLGIMHPDTNICGVSDMIDVAAEIHLIKQLVPSAKRIALLYRSGETNSLAMIKKMQEVIQKDGLEYMDCAISDESSIAVMTELACRKADLILAPTDNTVASAITQIVQIATRYKKPLIVSDTMLVPLGALAACGIDYAESGKQAGDIAYHVIIEKKPISQFTIVSGQATVVINKAKADELGIIIPESLQSSAIMEK